MLIALREVLDVTENKKECGNKKSCLFNVTHLCSRHMQTIKTYSTQVKAIRKFATNNGHRCYICGAELHYGEIDHMVLILKSR